VRKFLREMRLPRRICYLIKGEKKGMGANFGSLRERNMEGFQEGDGKRLTNKLVEEWGII